MSTRKTREFITRLLKSKSIILNNIEGVKDIVGAGNTANKIVIQFLLLWLLQEKGFFRGNKSFLVNKLFTDADKKIITISNYLDHLDTILDTIIGENGNLEYLRIIGKGELSAVDIPDSCFHLEGTRKKDSNGKTGRNREVIPLLNLLLGTDWSSFSESGLFFGNACESLIAGSPKKRKKTGSYYTPVEVADYINKLSIDNYLTDQIGKAGRNATDDYFQLLRELIGLQILDPAAGAGHFLESAANYLGQVYLDLRDKIDASTVLDIPLANSTILKRLFAIFKIKNDDLFLFYLKRDIIYPLNIFGTDINPLAIKVAKSRLFLGMVSENIISGEKNSELSPVFNLKTGNALISEMNSGGIAWADEFPDVFTSNGGFDIITGNPPYVNPQDVSYWHEIAKNGSKNLYDAFIRKSINLLHDSGRLGFIHPNSAYCQPKFKDFRDFLKQNVNDLTVINYAIRPQPVFKGVMQRTALTACKKDNEGCKSVKTSRYLRLTSKNRHQLLSNPPVHDSSDIALNYGNFIPKIGNEMDHSIFKKIFSWKLRIRDVIDKCGIVLYYHDSGESYWTKLVLDEVMGVRNGNEEPASHWKKIFVLPEYSSFIACLVNSSLFYWIWLTVSDCRDLTNETLIQVPLPDKAVIIEERQQELVDLLDKLMTCYNKNSRYVEKRKGYASPEIKVNRCKHLIDDIDRILGQIYGLEGEEIDYLIDYDGEMRKVSR